MNVRNIDRKRSQANQFVPRMEVLEDRFLLSCTITENSGILSIKSDNHGSGHGKHANVIQITDDGTGAAGNISVTCAGVSFTSTEAITEIQLKAGAGNDTVNYSLTGDTATAMDIIANLGQGDDTFTANLNDHLLLAGANLQFNVDGSQGKDNLSLSAVDADVENIASGAQLGINFKGGEGKDNISVNYEGYLTGNLTVNADGGNAKDTVAVNIQLNTTPAPTTPSQPSTAPAPAPTFGTVNATVKGGNGKDDLTLTVRTDVATDPFTVSALADGGNGKDTCVHTANVSVLHCEDDQVVT